MSSEWNCPLCWRKVPYGTKGCTDPANCPEEKNTNWEFYRIMYKNETQQIMAKAIGIGAISNDEQENNS